MIQIFMTREGQLEEVKEFTHGVWLNLTAPLDSEINEVADFYGIPLDLLKAALDEEERSRIERDDEASLVLVDTATVEEHEGARTYSTFPLGIILQGENIITVCVRKLPLIQDFIDGRIKVFSTNKKSRFLLQILFRNATYFLNYLKQIDRRSHEVEHELHISMKNKELIQLLELEKSLVYFSTSLAGNDIVLEKLEKSQVIKKYPDDSELLQDVITENKQAIEMATIYTNILSGTMDAFASVISNNLNLVMKTLTIITIVMTVPTLIASIYGMNVKLPLQESIYAFPMFLLISLCLCLLTYFILTKKKLL